MSSLPRRRIGLVAQRRGFTLLEVLLALSLAVVLLSLLTFSINVYMKASDAGRSDVERAQLARVLLRRMADDLRSTLWKNEGEAAASEAAEDSAAGDASSSGNAAGEGSGGSGSGSQSGAGSGTGGGTGSGDSSGDGSSASSPSTSTEVPPVMGLYGEAGYVQVDVSRLPRIEQYASAAAGTGDVVSDVKTVAYFCANANALSGGTGLTRREFDRAVTSYASMNGDISAWERDLAPIAAEVTAVQFLYFDAEYKQYTEWDTAVQGALPAAVEISIALSDGTATTTPPTTTGTLATTALTAAEGQTIYRLMVYLPQSQAPESSGASALEVLVSSTLNSASGSAGGSGGGDSGDGGGGNTPQGGGSSGRGGGYGNEGDDGGQGGPGGGGRGGGGRGGGGPGGDGPPGGEEGGDE